MKLHILTLLLTATASTPAQPLNLNKGVIVNLFQWKWLDIAKECEEFLAPNGFAAVQISPPNEHIISVLAVDRAWWERYQPVSDILESRSGSEDDLQEMLNRCNRVGVRVIADVVLNHMTAPNGFTGSAGTSVDYDTFKYPFLTEKDFHTPPCNINEHSNAHEVRFCQLKGMRDLDQLKSNVRDKQVKFLNKLISMGVAGFRIVAAKHMWPSQLIHIFERLHDLGSEDHVPPGTRPLIFFDVDDYGNGEAIKWSEYRDLGLVTDYRYRGELFQRFLGDKPIESLEDLGTIPEIIPSDESIVFIDNYDTQRIADTYKPIDRPSYKILIAFMLAYPLGTPQILSDYYYISKDEGPPRDNYFNILSPHPIEDNNCQFRWACEHRWPEISNMVRFRNVAGSYGVERFQKVGEKQVAFCRGNKACIAFNANRFLEMKTEIQTSLPKGKYCDVISGNLKNNKCTGKTIEVKADGKALIEIPELEVYPTNVMTNHVVAIHVKAKVQE